MIKHKDKVLAVERTVAMWKWLEKHPGQSKEDYLEEEVGPDDWPKVDTTCYLCEAWESECQACPLGDCADGSPFDLWASAREDKACAKQARRIWKACEGWLKQYNTPDSTIIVTTDWEDASLSIDGLLMGRALRLPLGEAMTLSTSLQKAMSFNPMESARQQIINHFEEIFEHEVDNEFVEYMIRVVIDEIEGIELEAS